MNTPISITFTIIDLFKVLFGTLGIIALIYLSLVLKEAYKILKRSNEFYVKNAEYIDIFMEDGATIVNKVSVVAKSIPDEPLGFLDELKSSFPMFQGLISFVMNIFGLNKNK